MYSTCDSASRGTQSFLGTNAATGPTGNAGYNTYTVTLNTLGSNWTVSYAQNGTVFRTATFGSNPTITGVGFGSYNLTGSVKNFSLTMDGNAVYSDSFNRAPKAVTAFYSTNGTTWTQLGQTQLVTLNSQSIGCVAVTSGHNTTSNTAIVQNVQVNGSTITPPADVHPPLTVSTLDNLGETTAISTYDGVPDRPTAETHERYGKRRMAMLTGIVQLAIKE